MKCKAIRKTGGRCTGEAVLLGLCILHYTAKLKKKGQTGRVALLIFIILIILLLVLLFMPPWTREALLRGR